MSLTQTALNPDTGCDGAARVQKEFSQFHLPKTRIQDTLCQGGGRGGWQAAAFPLRSQINSKMPESRHLGHLPSRHGHLCRVEAVFRAETLPLLGERPTGWTWEVTADFRVWHPSHM